VFAWTVLSLVFLDEVLAVVALGVWGFDAGGAWLAILAPVVGVALWWGFASPKAPYGGRVTRPVVKVLVFGAATLGLWEAGHPGAAIVLLLFSIAVNAAAGLPVVRAVDPRPSSGG
jgi:fumarate reductase subunit D